MKTKRMFQWMVAVAILVSSFASTGSALARYNCASYITVQWGDTLSGIAAYCGTTVDAIRAANPGLGWWLYAGQVLYIPTGYSSYPGSPANYPSAGGTYTIRWGDTLGRIAASHGVRLSALLAANPQIWNANLIFPGQVINIPATSYVPAYVPPPYVPPAVTPPVSAPGNFDGTLKVIATKGVNIRDQPNYTGKIVYRDDYTIGKSFYYRTNSVSYDATYRRTWVEVVFAQTSSGYSTGWLPVSGPQDYLNHTGPILDWVTPHIE
jgi:LysM repeat protein